jgi:oligoribonuclease
MTGLSPTKDRILEVAVIATDWKFNEIATYQSTVKQNPLILKRRMIGDFWTKNSNVRKTLTANNSTGKPSKQVEQDLLDLIAKNFGKTIYLAGNSIHQDRKFIEKYWPRLNQILHYRMLDVSAWKIYFEHALHSTIKKPEAHRALDDIRGSIEELKCYLKKIS